MTLTELCEAPMANHQHRLDAVEKMIACATPACM